MSARRARLPPIDHAAARELFLAVRDLNAVLAVLLETANTFDECAGALSDRDPVTLWRTATLARTAATELMLSLVGIDARAPAAPPGVPSGTEAPSSEEPPDESTFFRFARGPVADRDGEQQ
jgi:hypothetical protein